MLGVNIKIEKYMCMNEEKKLNELKKKGLSLRLNDDKFISLRKKIELYTKNFKNPEFGKIFYQCFFNTIDTTSYIEDDGSVFILTGDIPAMWLRDSSMQVMQYLFFASEDEEVRCYLKGVLKRQFKYLQVDEYANAFKRTETDYGEWDDKTITDKFPKIVWERKFELDSLCYPFYLACKYYEKTWDKTCFDDNFLKAFDKMVATIYIEQKHSERSKYRFDTTTKPQNVGVGDVAGEKGLIWCGFRPSDDICLYPYHIPDNMFLVSVLYKLNDIFENVIFLPQYAKTCNDLLNQLADLINKYGVIEIENGKKIYVSETDCKGNYNVNDDANVPSLLSIPYLEYPFIDKEIYKNTREFILSKKNKFYYEGKILKGIGSPHTPPNRCWPIALCMQALTSENQNEIEQIIKMLLASAKETGYMHESVDCNDVAIYSRPWFAWANSLFSYLILEKEIKL